MRQVVAFVPRGKGNQALEIGRANEATNLVTFESHGIDQEWDTVMFHCPNAKVESLLQDLQQFDPVHLSFTPHGFIALKPPSSEAPDQVVDVTHRSPIEIFLGGLQSIGSWKGFLGFAAASSIVAWIGLYTNTLYLLTASMLVAPFAGPAMNLALGTSRGDRKLITRSLLRYFSSLLVAIATSALLTLVFQQEIATELAIQTSLISSAAFLLPLTAGAAGALHLAQSERASLVSGAATGMLIAASLAPPAGLIGIAMVIQEWAIARTGLYLLLLQLVGINLSGAIVFSLFGLTPQGVRFSRGRQWLRWTSFAATAGGIAILLLWQFWTQPDLQRSSRSRKIEAEVKNAVNSSDLAKLVEANVRFTRADIPGQNTLLIVAYVQKNQDTEKTSSEIKEALTHEIRQQIDRTGFQVVPLVDLTVLQED